MFRFHHSVPCARVFAKDFRDFFKISEGLGHFPTSKNPRRSHPGNYTFFDNIQISLGTCGEDACSLRVLATVVSHPSEGFYLFDAGSKCLGLDQGAHGNSAIKGFGYVVGHPELTIVGLSEEVAKVKADGTCDLQVGDQVEIIPNHSCSTANNTGWYTCMRGDEIVDFIAVDARENSKKKGTL